MGKSDVLLLHEYGDRLLERHAPHTVRTYERILDLLVAFALTRRKSVAHLTPEELDEFTRHDETGAKRTLQTRTLHLTTARTFYSWLVETDRIAASPAERVVPAPWAGTPSADGLTDEQAAELEAASFSRSPHPDRDRVAVLLSLHAGLKLGEAHRLTWLDVGDDRLFVGGKKARTLKLTPQLRMALSRWRAEVPAEAFVFPSRVAATEPISDKMFTRWVLAAGDAMGVDGLTSETLRATYRDRLVDQGKPMELVAELCGYASKTVAKRAARAMRAELQPCRCDREYDVRPLVERCADCLGIGANVVAPEGYLEGGNVKHMVGRLRALSTALSHVPKRLALMGRDDAVSSRIAAMTAQLEVAATALAGRARAGQGEIKRLLEEHELVQRLRADGTEARKFATGLLVLKRISLVQSEALDRTGANASFIAWALTRQAPVPELWPVPYPGRQR